MEIGYLNGYGVIANCNKCHEGYRFHYTGIQTLGGDK